jgi:hypothetical protein
LIPSLNILISLLIWPNNCQLCQLCQLMEEEEGEEEEEEEVSFLLYL